MQQNDDKNNNIVDDDDSGIETRRPAVAKLGFLSLKTIKEENEEDQPSSSLNSQKPIQDADALDGIVKQQSEQDVFGAGTESDVDFTEPVANFDIPIPDQQPCAVSECVEAQMGKVRKGKRQQKFSIDRKAKKGVSRQNLDLAASEAIGKSCDGQAASDSDDEEMYDRVQEQLKNTKKQPVPHLKEKVEFSSQEDQNDAVQEQALHGSQQDSLGAGEEPEAEQECDDNISMGSPTEDTETALNIAEKMANVGCRRSTRLGFVNHSSATGKSGSVKSEKSANSFIDFSANVLQAQGGRENALPPVVKQLGRVGSANSGKNSCEITPVSMKPSIAVTNKERAQLSTLEDSMSKELKNGQLFNEQLLKLLAQHMSICHPEVLATIEDESERSAANHDEPKKRGRKTTKQKVRELVREMKPLSDIKCQISFTIPDEYAQKLNNTSSRISSASKHNERDLESVISECKTRNMRRKVQELTGAQAGNQSRTKQAKGTSDPALAEAEAAAAGESQCLLNLSFDMSVQKLVQIASDGDQAQSSRRGSIKRSTASSGAAVASTGAKLRPSLISNVTIAAEK